MCVPDIAEHWPTCPPPLLKSNSRSSTLKKTGKEIQLNFPPIEESGPRENGPGRGGAPAIIPNPTFSSRFPHKVG